MRLGVQPGEPCAGAIQSAPPSRLQTSGQAMFALHLPHEMFVFAVPHAHSTVPVTVTVLSCHTAEQDRILGRSQSCLGELLCSFQGLRCGRSPAPESAEEMGQLRGI